MTRRARGFAIGVALLLALSLAAAWWFEVQSQPDRVGPRFVDGLKSRHPDSAVERLDGDVLHVAMPSGSGVDVGLSILFDRCEADRLACGGAIDRALDDVDRAEASTRAPDPATLRAVVTGDGAGYRYGYLADPLVGSFEVRYALASGVASTFVTQAIADRLGLSREALKRAALAGSRSDVPRLEPVRDVEAPLFRVRSDGDPAAALLDPERMKAFAATLGARRLYAIVPTRDALAIGVANEASARALDALRLRLRGKDARTLDGGLLAYDVDAAEGRALSIAVRSSALPPP